MIHEGTETTRVKPRTQDTHRFGRQIPATMATQHPDHAKKPSWLESPFINIQQEIEEVFRMYSEFGITEYKWDWEGKYVDEAVIERLLHEHFLFFKDHPLGKDFFLTFRLPNPKVETEFRLGRAFMGLVSAAGLAKSLGLHSPPLFEVILPMTESSSEMMAIHEAFAEVAALTHPLLRRNSSGRHALQVIPLFEQVDVIMSADRIVQEYADLHRAAFGEDIPYLRPYLARSDPALNSGLISAVLAVKVGLSRLADWSGRSGIPSFPLVGVAALPFRGGLTPASIDQFIDQYAGTKTVIIQSAFRYDFPEQEVRAAINTLNETLPKTDAIAISPRDEERLREMVRMCEIPYRKTIESDGFAALVNTVASDLPRRRERVQHSGLFGYSRGVGRVRLPRAIAFTGALYSLGVPPELIGSGRGVREIVKAGFGQIFERFYPMFRYDIIRAGCFLQKDVLNRLARESTVWHDIEDDVSLLEEYLGVELGPQTPEEHEHARLVQAADRIRAEGRRDAEHYELLALMRKSIG